MGASSKIIHLRLATAAADEELLWQTMLLRHSVLPAHRHAVPGDEQAACSSGTRRRNLVPARDTVILLHNNKLPPLLRRAAAAGVGAAPQQLRPICVTICYICCCALDGRVSHTTTGASTISHPQLVLRHTHTHSAHPR